MIIQLISSKVRPSQILVFLKEGLQNMGIRELGCSMKRQVPGPTLDQGTMGNSAEET